MKASGVIRRTATWTGAVLAAVAILMIGLLMAIDAGHGYSLLVRAFALRTGRDIEVRGAVHAQLLSRNPEVIAEQVIIGNPPWMPAGRTAEIGRLTMVLKPPWFNHSGGLVRLEMQGATLHLLREADGRANWQMTDPAHKRVHRNSPIIRSLSVPDAHVELQDARRHLQFVGTVSASGPPDAGTPQPARLVGTGQLNGRPDHFEVTADPLSTASHRTPYHFRFAEQSSGSHIEGSGQLPQPFMFEILDADFEAAGADLKDLYFLTGVHLLDTASYHLTGKFSRRGTHTEFKDLAVTSGQSDLRGTVSVESSPDHKQFALDLSSRNLRLADLGIRAAGRTTAPKPPWLLSDAKISLKVLRIGDATVKYRADQVQVGRIALQEVSARARLDAAVLTVTSLTAQVLGGHASGHLTLNATKDVPAAAVDLRIADLQLGQMPYKDPDHPPVEGSLRAHVLVKGFGRSMHQVAASADGTLTAQIRAGAIRESFAELTGLDLRGLGLLMIRDKKQIPVRCAVARLKAHDGTLSVQSLIADTDPVQITADGDIHLDSEDLDLRIHGAPKHLRLMRLRAPLLVQGTLAHPTIHIGKEDSRLLVVDLGKDAQPAQCEQTADVLTKQF